ncbi:hypothetical protein, partial [Melaminivora alkalimesophila]|uniref:hypothetical protein n=1 Tax=Melaminivora alkalimesophila TaxID=1165852 RepID=UPI000590773C
GSSRRPGRALTGHELLQRGEVLGRGHARSPGEAPESGEAGMARYMAGCEGAHPARAGWAQANIRSIAAPGARY